MTQAQWAKLMKDYHTAKIAADNAKVLASRIKEGLKEEGRAEMQAGGFIARVTVVESTRLDSKALKESEPDTYARYSVPTKTERLYFK